MKVAALVQKPYDLLNVLEYLHLQGWSRKQLTVFLIGKHSNVLAAERLCRALKISVEHLADPDIYGQWVVGLTAAQFPKGKALLALKALLLVPSFFWWHICWLYMRLRRRRATYDVLLYDPWRSKCFFLSSIAADRQVLFDGGYSTITYKLCDAFASGGARELVATSLRAQKTHVPWLVRTAFMRRVDKQAPFFTCYAGQVPSSSRFLVLANNYAYSRATAAAVEMGDYAMVLGIPMLRHIDHYIEVARECLQNADIAVTDESVQYRFHPQDLNRSKLDTVYAQMLEEGIAYRSLSCNFPEYGLEFDFLFFERLPRFIVTYESSSTVWLQQVFGTRIELKILQVR
ncbi:hypothetical protein MCEMAEM21_00069 [Oxalobacteraceae bacterium]